MHVARGRLDGAGVGARVRLHPTLKVSVHRPAATPAVPCLGVAVLGVAVLGVEMLGVVVLQSTNGSVHMALRRKRSEPHLGVAVLGIAALGAAVRGMTMLGMAELGVAVPEVAVLHPQTAHHPSPLHANGI